MDWPKLHYESAQPTFYKLHMVSQMVGKVMLACRPWVNHSWHVTLDIIPSGMTTGLLTHGSVSFSIDINLLDHRLVISCHRGQIRHIDFKHVAVSEIYGELSETLSELGIYIEIDCMPCEVAHPTDFRQDDHTSYHPEQAMALNNALLLMHPVFYNYRSQFRGKSSDVLFFWGSFDLSVTRFNGKNAPMHPGGIPGLADEVVREAYSRELINVGFWPGNEMLPEAAFYAYIYPGQSTFAKAELHPKAYWHEDMGEFILPYNKVRKAKEPENMLAEFLHAAYNKAAESAGWNVDNLRQPELESFK